MFETQILKLGRNKVYLQAEVQKGYGCQIELLKLWPDVSAGERLENLLRKLVLGKSSNVRTMVGSIRGVTVHDKAGPRVDQIIIRGQNGQEITINDPTLVVGECLRSLVSSYIVQYSERLVLRAHSSCRLLRRQSSRL